LCFLPSTHYPLYDFDLRATHARTLLPAALASVSFGFVLVRVRVRNPQRPHRIQNVELYKPTAPRGLSQIIQLKMLRARKRLSTYVGKPQLQSSRCDTRVTPEKKADCIWHRRNGALFLMQKYTEARVIFAMNCPHFRGGAGTLESRNTSYTS